ncbi:MAG: HAD family hydrolase [Akkermansiaceae bacterium]|nr:HAD family hydrolase [Akkermansiaceae bacterium]
MKVAIVHYHFELSGVTKVMASSSRGLRKQGIEHVMLVGSIPEGVEEDFPLREVRGLSYVPDKAVGDATVLVRYLREAAEKELGGKPDLWHFHNHALGKNFLMADTVALMAEQGERLVLHMHDLIEEGRQQNYAVVPDPTRLYPTGPHIRYVFLNEQDRELFQNNGLEKDRAELTVNPVPIPEKLENKANGNPILFAPIRAIRRKNMGELVMLAALAPNGTRIAISRAPKDKGAFRLHETWRKFAGHQRLPIGFDVVGRYYPAQGTPNDFMSWVEHSSHFVTTSVSEGFGMTFLEAAAFGKPLLGRNVPRVTNEHAKRKIEAGDFYDKLLVPTEWVDVSILRQHFDTTIQRNYRYLGEPLDNLTHERAFASLLLDGWLDFGNMPEPVQQAVVERCADPGAKNVPVVQIGEERRPAKQWLHEVLEKRESPVRPEQLEEYSEESFTKSLKGIYEATLKGETGEVSYIDPAPILAHCLKPERFHFLTSVIPPRPTSWSQYKAVVFDIYGTLMTSPQVDMDEPNPTMDGLMQAILEHHGFDPPESPTEELISRIKQRHEDSDKEFPEVDIREVWKDILGVDPRTDLTDLVLAIEAECRPVQPMPGAAGFIRRLAHSGVTLGLLSNGQCNTLKSLGGIRDFFAPDLVIISYKYGIAKPGTEIFRLLADRLATMDIKPAECLYIGNDPVKDIVPAAEVGFKTGLFTGHPDSYRPGNCTPDHEIAGWPTAKGNLRRC